MCFVSLFFNLNFEKKMKAFRILTAYDFTQLHNEDSVKILADAKTDEVLGVHMIGARCADLIAEAVTAMEFRASAEDISRMSHAHPTFAEAIKEAALAATANRALHV
jgi:dihydrolipoamide dehydrogenase